MLHRALAILLLLALVGTNFSWLLVYVGFNANRTYVATALCENKARPSMHCNGKCYLMKKLREADEQQKSEGRQNQKKLSQESILKAGFTIKFHASFLAIISTPYICFYLFPLFRKIYRDRQIGQFRDFGAY